MYTIKDLIPIALSSNSCEIGEVIFSGKWGSSFEGWKAFDKLENTFWGSEKPVSWLGFRFANKTVVKKYKVNSGGNNTSYAIKKWTFEGSDDGNNWTVLDTQTNQTDWTPAVAKEFDVDNNEEYFYYRINITENNGSNFFTDIVEFVLYGYQPVNKILLLSNGETYSISENEAINWYETNMTSNTLPSPLVANASSIYSSSYDAWKAFDNSEADANSWLTLSGQTTGWIQLDFGSKTKVNSFYLNPRSNSLNGSPKDFEILGSNDGVNFIPLGTFNNQTNWIANEKREFSFKNINSYRYYRLNILSNNGNSSYVSINEIKFGYKGLEVIQIPSHSEQNLIAYGMDSPVQFDGIFKNKNYILSPTESKNENGLLTTQINRKPLSIGIS